MKKILIVDDEKNIRLSLSIGLRREGYQVDDACDAMEALMKIKQDSFDVLLSDVKMPVVSGIELAERASRLCPQMVTILMSAYNFNDFENGKNGRRQYHWLSKPFDMGELLELLNQPEAGSTLEKTEM